MRQPDQAVDVVTFEGVQVAGQQRTLASIDGHRTRTGLDRGEGDPGPLQRESQW